MNKNIAILTLWDSDNYGAFLQAYALNKKIESMGYNPFFLELTKEKRTIRYYLTKSLNTTIYNNRLFSKYKKARKKYFSIKDTDYNILFIGSDEVWNINNPSFIHYNEYFGIGISCEHIFSYAPSCNGVNKEELIKFNKDYTFSKFQRISVRDSTTYELVKNVGNISANLVLDPTLLLYDFEDMISETKFKDYILIYGYSFTEEEIYKIKQVSKQTGLKLISIGPYLSWADIQFPASPNEFLGLIKNAEYVITSTFHGSIFAIIFEKQFISICRSNNKIIELLKMLQLEERNSTFINNYLSLLDKEINYKNVNNLLSNYRSSSNEFLESCFRDSEVIKC